MDWFSQDLTPIKLGTIPALVLIHGSDKIRLKVGQWIRIKEHQGDKWHKVFIDQINEGGTIFATR